ncbi:hypothetical protein [Belnapia rosea]|uniref:hypothetical protein n=1 Tax=Belnapia rosea TaxID=938405 RepID=UPI0008853425|nr:hypothetical protein [Belnapia rosea]SDB74624.1 hypothetical protein SAMN02927895_05326 [Belnapia rosea]
MLRPSQVKLQTHRGYRLEVKDDGGDGWMVTIYTPDSSDKSVLRTSVPDGLTGLLDEARSHIDRRVDGQPWAHERR